jgi:LmbE family N-acetylglucosaminyl deacetylase
MSFLLILSPHLDDAVISCGSHIAAAIQEGRDVLVATCFTSPGETAAQDLQRLYQQRRSDDMQALRQLGAHFRHLEFTDAPFRDPQYHNVNTILFHHRLPEEEYPLCRQLTFAISRLIGEVSPDELLFPLGTGGHIDHHIVWECGKNFWDGQWSFSLYEDLPYALLPGWSDVRRQQLLEDVPLQPISPSFKQDLRHTGIPFVRNYIMTPEDLGSSIDKYDKEYSCLDHRSYNAASWVFGKRTFIRSLHTASAEFLDAKCHAIARYATEWPVLFGPDQGNIREVLSSPFSREKYEEVCWTLKPML